MIPVRLPYAKAFAKGVFFDHEPKPGDQRRSDTVVVLAITDVN